MPVKRIDSIYNTDAILAEHAKVIAAMKESRDKIIELNNTRINAKEAPLSGFAQATEQLNKAINESTNSTNKAVKAKKELTRAELEARLASQQRTTALKNEIVENKSAAGSYDQLNAQLKRLQTEYKALGSAQRQSAQGQGLQNAITSTKNQLKSLDAGLGDHQRNVGNYTKSIGDGFQRIATRVIEYAAAYAGFNAIKVFFSDTISEALEAEKANIRFKSTLDNLGRADAFDRLSQKAVDMAKQFKFIDNDEIVGVFEKLVTYGKLSENQINQLTPVIINFAAKSGITVQESASVIIKALEGNGKALKEYGINIKDAKTDSERFGIVMSDLGKRVEGAADAFGETTTGKIAATNQQFKDLKEQIGIGLLPVINKFLGMFNGLITMFKDIADNGLGNAVGRAFKGINIYMFQGAEALKAYQKEMQEFGTASAAVKKQTIVDFKPTGFNIIRSDLTPQQGYGLAQAPDKSNDPFGDKETNDKKEAARKDNLQHLKESVDNEFEIYKIGQEAKMRLYDADIKSDKTHYLDKLVALSNYTQAAQELFERQEQEEIQNKERAAAREIQSLNEEKSGKSAAEKKRIDQNIKITEENLQKDILLIKATYADKQKELLERTGSEIQDIIDAQHKAEEKSQDDSLSKMEAREKEHLAKVKAQLEATAAAQQKAIDERNAAREKELENISSYEQAAFDIGEAFGDAKFENDKNRLQDQIELSDKKAQRAIEEVNASTRTEQEKAAAITIIQARAEAEKEALQQKEKRADYEKARFDKQIAILKMIAQIGIDIAEGKFSAAALAGAALIKLIATPIPKYKSGRGTGKEETAIVGDGGVPEYIHRADGTIEKTPAVETLTHLMPKDRVYKNKQEMMKELAMSSMLSNYVVNKNGGIDKADIENLAGRIENAVSEIKINTQVITKDGWRNHNQRLADYDKWVDRLKN